MKYLLTFFFNDGDVYVNVEYDFSREPSKHLAYPCFEHVIFLAEMYRCQPTPSVK